MTKKKVSIKKTEQPKINGSFSDIIGAAMEQANKKSANKKTLK